MRKQILFLLSFVALLALDACTSNDPDPEVAPSGLTYSPNSYTVSEGTAGASSAAAVSGTTPITFSLSGNNEPAISINSSTGVISSTGALTAGTYDLNVTASNNAGSQTFNNAFKVIVTASDIAPSGLSYASSSLRVRKHESASTGAPSLEGSAPLSFEITNSADLPSQISINSSTGVITVAKGLAHGSYSVDVKASNSIGEVTVAGAVTIVSQEVVFTGSVGVQGFIQSKCSPCHVSGGTRTDYTVFNNAKNSIDNIISRTNSGSMPQGGPQLSQEEIDLFRQWKADGLKEQ